MVGEKIVETLGNVFLIVPENLQSFLEMYLKVCKFEKYFLKIFFGVNFICIL